MTFARKELTASLKALIEKATGRPVGVSRVPYDLNGEPPEYPYVIIEPKHRGTFDGPAFQDDPWTMVECHYGIKSVGLREDQADGLADKVRHGVLGKWTLGENTGQYNYQFNNMEATVIQRRPGPISPGPLPVDGKLVQVDDEYVFVVQTD